MKTVEKKTEPAGEKNLKRIHENQLMIEFSSKKKQSEHGLKCVSVFNRCHNIIVMQSNPQNGE